MKIMYRGGGWYIANFARREFATYKGTWQADSKRASEMSIRWTPMLKRAHCYKDMGIAKRRAAMLNQKLGGAVPPCTVVTALAAKCLDAIWDRERYEAKWKRVRDGY